MIIYELNNSYWPIRTWYCNKLCTSGSNFFIFRAKWFKCNFWSSLKRQQKLWFFLDSNLKTFSWHVCVTVRDWDTIGELTLSNFERDKKKTCLESPKAFTVRWMPIRIQLECPYNSSNETKITHVWVFTFLYSLHKQCTFLYISTCARGEFYTIVHSNSNTVFHSVNEWISFWMNRVSQWFNGPFRWSASQCAYYPS